MSWQRPALVVAITSAVVFGTLLTIVILGLLGAGSVDASVDRAAHTTVLAHATVLALARALTNIGAPVVVDGLAALAAVALWLSGRPRAAAYVALVRLTAQVVDSTVKVLVGRARPALAHPVAHASGYSFPSGHATGAASLYLPLAVVAFTLLTRRHQLAAVVVFAVLACLVVATTRVLLGVHYPSDVLAGLALGTACTAACLRVLSRLPGSRRRERGD